MKARVIGTAPHQPVCEKLVALGICFAIACRNVREFRLAEFAIEPRAVWFPLIGSMCAVAKPPVRCACGDVFGFFFAYLHRAVR